MDATIDQLLKGWADRQRLNRQQAEAIRAAIVAQDEDLGYEWWNRLATAITQGLGSSKPMEPITMSIDQWFSVFDQPIPH